MKNLKTLVNLKHSLPMLKDSKQVTVGTLDYNNNFFKRTGYIFLYIDGDIFTLNPIGGTCTLFFSIHHLYDRNPILVSFLYNSVLNSINIILENGDVLSVSLTDDLSQIANEVQCVGSIGNGLQTLALSPDTETIVFLTGDNVLILMSGDFDPVNESELFGSDQGEQEMINVGWGKKETQFHGSEGKAAAKKKFSEEELSEKLDPLESNQKPVISWRGDSTLFAVNYWCPEKKHRRVKIFDKTGTLQCTSEFLPGLEKVMSWRPSGNLIALAQRLPNKYVICFMEKNGLRHGDFTLPPHIQVLELSWNCESTILSAVCVDESVNQSCVLLWTSGNYHWYLKQRLDFKSGVVAMYWDDVVGNLAHIVLSDGTYHAHQWVWEVNHSAGIADDDLAVVAVIDGCDLKLSAFKKCVIPPPMCGASITLPAPAMQVMFSPLTTNRNTDASPNDLCVYLSDGRLAFVKGMESSPQLSSVIPIEWECPGEFLLSPSFLSHWLWLAEEQLLCVLCSDTTYLCQIEIKSNVANIVSKVPVCNPVLTISQRGNAPQAVIQLSTGALHVYREGFLTPSSCDDLPEPCVAVHGIGHIVARTHNNHLYVDGELVGSNVTSFFCLPQFLIMTLSSHQLCVASAESGFKMPDESEGTTRRRLERGSTLVIVVGHSVVLQLPRGNLETVEPRALTLVTAARLLDTGDYKTVAQLLRRQRINLNLVVDHNPSAFLLSVPRMVAQIRDPQWLCVFLAELSEQDVTRSMYAGYYKHNANRGPPLADKVNRVCNVLREAMTQTTEDQMSFLQPVLSTYVRAGRVGEAIKLADSDQALGYLTLLIDTDRLYEEALSVYDLEKALKIAGKSLKDPKEYVAYLNELRAMEPAYMRFTLDKRLRKPQSALRNLSQCTDRVEECLQYVQDTGLYTLALDLFKDQPDIYKRICILYGVHLEDKRNYQEAGLMYRRGGDVEKAIPALTKAGCWRQSLTLALQNDYSEADLEEVQKALYSALRGRQEYAEAAELSSQLGWLDQAVSCWVDARCWSQAIYVCHNKQCKHLIESTVKPALTDHQSRILTDLRTKKDEMDKHSARLLVVRQKKANMDNNFDAMSDIQSDTSSLSSFSTSTAGTRATKNTRKAQRKLWSLKEGNPREEQALLYTITELIQNTERLTGEVHTTCLALAELALDSEACTLHSTMSAALGHIEQVRHSVWPASVIKKTGSDADAVDPTSVDMQLTYPPNSCVSQSWKLSIYS